MKQMGMLVALLSAGVLALGLLGGVSVAGDKGKDKGDKDKVSDKDTGDKGKDKGDKDKVVGKDKGKTPEIPPRAGKTEVIRLFNGKDLDGWEGHEKLWSVKDSTIIAKNTESIKVSTYLLTKKKYTDFRLTATVKLVQSEMHSGISFWGRKAPDKGDPFTYAGHLVMFPSGWGMYDLFGRNGLPVSGAPAKKVGKQHDWNDLEILAQGNRVRVAVNGVLVVDWRDPEPKRILEGPIGLQLHSNNVPQEIHFKDLILTTFPESQMITLQPPAEVKDKKK
jgi:Domain of Unknown Function (DUF1080)